GARRDRGRDAHRARAGAGPRPGRGDHQRRRAARLRAAGGGPPPVEEVLLDADLTVVIPGRPAESLLPLLDWTEPVSRGGALTLRFTTASVRRALGDG